MDWSLAHDSITGEEYSAVNQDFIDAFVAAVLRVFPDTVLQWEAFYKGNAITQLTRFRDRLCTFNDDMQGTASVVGAGASAQGIAELLVAALCADGLSREEARGRLSTRCNP